MTGEMVKINLLVDNQSAIHMLKNGAINKKTRHIDVRYKYINEKVEEAKINVKYCPTNDQ